MIMAKKSKVDKEREIMAEERTLLAMIRTGLAVLGMGFVILKMFVDFGWWSYGVASVLIILGLTIIVEDFIKFQKKRDKLMELEKE